MSSSEKEELLRFAEALKEQNFDTFAHDESFRDAIFKLKASVDASKRRAKAAAQEEQLLEFARAAKTMDFKKYSKDPKFRNAMKKIQGRIQKLSEYAEPKVVNVHEDSRSRLTKRGNMNNLPYMHRNPAV